MKNLIFSLALLSLPIRTLGATGENEILSKAQAQEILTVIDRTCGDTWCEGDYHFRFNDITCNLSTHSCQIKFIMIENNDDRSRMNKIAENSDFVAKLSSSHRAACIIKNIQDYSDLKSGVNLNTRFYESLTDCIQTLITNIR